VKKPSKSASTVASKRLNERLAKLAAQGKVTLPTRKPLLRVRAVKIAGPSISSSVIEDRR
jgi:hypothetical protein